MEFIVLYFLYGELWLSLNLDSDEIDILVRTMLMKVPSELFRDSP